MTQYYRFLPGVFLGAFLLLLALPVTSVGQTDLEIALQQYDAEGVTGFIGPMAHLYGADINSGMFHSADIPMAGFHFELDFIGMGSLVKDDYKNYVATLPQGFQQPTAVQPTIFGGVAPLISDPSGLQYKGSNGVIDASLFSHGVAHLSFGSVNGTDGFVRFLASPELGGKKFPKTSLIGGGLRHSISQYIPDIQFALAVGGGYNKLTIGDLVEIGGVSFGAQGSKTWDSFTWYGGLQWEKTTMNVKYTSSASVPVNVDVDGDNKIRLTTGGALKLGFFRIFADANIGSVMNFSGGIGFGN